MNHVDIPPQIVTWNRFWFVICMQHSETKITVNAVACTFTVMFLVSLVFFSACVVLLLE